MKLFSTPILVLLPLCASLISCQVQLLYKFKSQNAKAEYIKSNKFQELDDICVHWAPKVHSCGRQHLSEVNNIFNFKSCIEAIGFDKAFEEEIINMVQSDFISPAHFEKVYNQKLIDYVKKIDSRFEETSKDEDIKLVFEWNLLAIGLLILSGVAVTLINKIKGNTLKSSSEV